ncbi:MAG: 4-hydroxy-tetrahydrodipicolinate reductase [Kiritimatiellae bacterium]|nr:4-hydroxy-tetrahydrodipicolinate reductase [Kiritimatiellia bacterium]
MKIAIVGAAGRMGRMLVKMVEEKSVAPELEVGWKIDIAEGFDKAWGDDCEGVVDFSFHAAVPELAEKAAAAGIPYVIGTTGLTADEQARIDECAKKIPVVQSGNYSLGVNLLLGLVEQAAKVLGVGYDIEVVEMHHKHKKDAPSGTALMLAKAAKAGRGGGEFVFGRHGETGERKAEEIAIHALRGGSVVGDHTVMFAGDVERIELVHKAQSREAFAAGALRALVWAKGRAPRIWTMKDILFG